METLTAKTKIEEAQETTIFTLSNFNYKNDSLDLKIEIEKNNYYDWVMESVDETTSPRGVAPRYFVQEEELQLDVDDFDEDGDYTGSEHIPSCLQDQYLQPLLSEFNKDNNGDYYRSYWVISTWGSRGNNYKSGKYDGNNTFVTEEEAANELFERIEKYDFENDCNRDTQYYMSEEEAQEAVLRFYSEIWRVSEATAKSILAKKENLEKRRNDLQVIADENRKKEAAERLEKIKNEGGIEALLVGFFKNEYHPAPQEIYDYKEQSGLSWNALRKLYK
jgi:hypothetical protein